MRENKNKQIEELRFQVSSAFGETRERTSQVKCGCSARAIVVIKLEPSCHRKIQTNFSLTREGEERVSSHEGDERGDREVGEGRI